MVEQGTENPCVVGSIPSPGTTFYSEETNQVNMSSVPHTLAFEIRRLQGRLKEVDQEMVKHQSDKENILNFEWMRFKKEKSDIQEEIQYLTDLLHPTDPDPTTYA